MSDEVTRAAQHVELELGAEHLQAAMRQSLYRLGLNRNLVLAAEVEPDSQTVHITLDHFGRRAEIRVSREELFRFNTALEWEMLTRDLLRKLIERAKLIPGFDLTQRDAGWIEANPRRKVTLKGMQPQAVIYNEASLLDSEPSLKEQEQALKSIEESIKNRSGEE